MRRKMEWWWKNGMMIENIVPPPPPQLNWLHALMQRGMSHRSEKEREHGEGLFQIHSL
jgi:hypothetical protein